MTCNFIKNEDGNIVLINCTPGRYKMKQVYRDPSDGQLYHNECLTEDEKKDCELVVDTISDDEMCSFCEDYLSKTPDADLEDIEKDE